jgi:hypothetical protein
MYSILLNEIHITIKVLTSSSTDDVDVERAGESEGDAILKQMKRYQEKTVATKRWIQLIVTV